MPETKSEILAILTDINAIMEFLLSLKSVEIQKLFKVGNGYTPFLDKSYSVAIDHPDILPAVFNLVEFKKDHLLSKDLTAVSSDAIVEALEVYSVVKLNSGKVPGLNVANTEMAQFFKKTRKKAEAKV